MDARLWLALVVLSLVWQARCSGLVDEPFLGDDAQYLDGTAWAASSSSGLRINASVPGDLISDLASAGVIGDPLYEQVWIDYASLWDDADWTYTRAFSLQNASWVSASEVYLVFDGLKMSADISLNGQALGSAFDQFVRYTYPVRSILKVARLDSKLGAGIYSLQATQNVLSVTFPCRDSRMDPEDRFMACSGGWDWAQYSSLISGQTPLGVRTLTKGIWKSVYVVPVSSAAITDVAPLVSYLGAYPTAPLTDATKSAFNVSVRVFLSAPSSAAVSGTLAVSCSWSSAIVSTPLTVVNSTMAALTITALPSEVQLWWPNGLGAQPLYNVTITWTPKFASEPILLTTRRIGFRVIALVTDNDSNPASLSGVSGSGNLTMRFKVNGANIWARGANWIPMEDYDGRSDALAITCAVQSAAQAGMNLLRVWGGGIWEYDAFYDTADELGVMIFHDAQYSNQDDSYHMPIPSAVQQSEIQHQIRRLSTHPSIALWSGCNECGGSGVVQAFVIPIIAAEDPSRPLWPSCPSAGWQTGVNRLSSLVNGQPMTLITAPSTPQDVTGGVLQENASYEGFPVYNITSAGSATDCLNTCIADERCVVALYIAPKCTLTGGAYQLPLFIAGVIACIPYRNNVPPSPFVPTLIPAPPQCEQHGPYQYGSAFPTVNGVQMDFAVHPMLPPVLSNITAYGPAAPGVFVSEFGASSLSSFESMSPTLDPSHWGLHGGTPPDPCQQGVYPFKSTCNGSNPMAQRNYPCDSYYDAYYGSRAAVPTSAVGQSAFQAQLYLCQLASALTVKSVVEYQRSRNIWGLMEWQLNEMWPTGGWGSIEYGTVGYTYGQVRGGRWKPLHYFFAAALFKDQFVACGSDARCFVKNDNPLAPLNGSLQLTLERLSDGASLPLFNASVNIAVGANSVGWFCGGNWIGHPTTPCTPWSKQLAKAGCVSNGSDCLLAITLSNSAAQVIFTNYQLLSSPQFLAPLSNAPLALAIGSVQPDGTVPINVTASAPALFVHLTTLASGRFSDNSFPLVARRSATISFIPIDPLNITLLRSSLRVEHLGQYLN